MAGETTASGRSGGRPWTFQWEPWPPNSPPPTHLEEHVRSRVLCHARNSRRCTSRTRIGSRPHHWQAPTHDPDVDPPFLRTDEQPQPAAAHITTPKGADQIPAVDAQPIVHTQHHNPKRPPRENARPTNRRGSDALLQMYSHRRTAIGEWHSAEPSSPLSLQRSYFELLAFTCCLSLPGSCPE